MARVTRDMSAAWVNEAILVLDGAAPSRHFWSRWMDRALAPQATRLVQRPAANDPEALSEDDDEDQHADLPARAQPALLRFD